MEKIYIPWEDFAAAAYRHSRTIVTCVVIAVAFMSYRVWTTPPLYEATATLLVRDNRAHTSLSPDAASEPSRSSIGEDDLTSQAAMLDNPALLREVLEPYRSSIEEEDRGSVLSLITDAVTLPLWLPGELYAWWHDSPAPSAFGRVVANLHENTLITVVPRSNLIEVSYADDSPKWAAKLVNELVAKHIERQTELSQQGVAEKFYDEQSQLLAKQAQSAEDKRRAFYRKGGVVAGPEERKAVRKRLAEINGDLATAETELAEATVRVDFLTDAITEHPSRLAVGSAAVGAAGTATNQVKPRILELSLQRSELLSRYRPDSVKIRDLDKQIALAKRLLNEEQKLIEETSTTPNPTYQKLELDLVDARAKAATLAGRIDALKIQKAEFTAKSADLADAAAIYDRLEHDVEQTTSAYRFYDKKREAARFSNALDESRILNVTVAEPATPSSNPLPSRGGRWILFGAIIGLMSGFVLAYGMDRLDPSVKSAAEAGRLSGLPILGEVRGEPAADQETVQVEPFLLSKKTRAALRWLSAGGRKIRHAMFRRIAPRPVGYGLAAAAVVLIAVAATSLSGESAPTAPAVAMPSAVEETEEVASAIVPTEPAPVELAVVVDEPSIAAEEAGDDADDAAPTANQIVLAAVTPEAPAAAPTTEVVIPEGKNLLSVMRDFYGTDDETLVKQILDANPQLTDPDHIVAGAKLVFPTAPEGDLR